MCLFQCNDSTFKKPPEVICKNSNSSKFRIIYRKTHVLEFLLNKETLLKRDSNTGVFLNVYLHARPGKQKIGDQNQSVCPIETQLETFLFRSFVS